MNKAFILTAIISGFMTSGCTKGFIATLKDSTLNPTATNSNRETPDGGPNPLLEGEMGGQPGLISLGGVLVSSPGADSKASLASQIRISQTTGKGASGKTTDNIREENKMKVLEATSESTYLTQIESRKDFVQFGCNTSVASIAGFTNGLTETKINLEESPESLNLKARVIILCGTIRFPQAFVTITADQLILMDANFELANTNAAGFVSIAANKLQLNGTNQISTRGMDSKSIILDGPPITASVQQEVTSQGTLSLKTFGGNKVDQAVFARAKK